METRKENVGTEVEFSCLPEPKKDSLSDTSAKWWTAGNDLYPPCNLELLSQKCFWTHSGEIITMLLQEKTLGK